MKLVEPFFVGLGLLLIPFFSLFGSSLLFLSGFSLNAFVFPGAVLLSLLISAYLIKPRKNKPVVYGIHVFMILLFVGFAFFMGGLFFDYSFDGQDYHQYIIYELAEGWNPFFGHTQELVPALEKTELWANHYAKGLETVAATIACFSGDVELGKAVNFILFFSSGFFVLVFLKDFFSSVSHRKRLLLILIIIFSPTVIVQLFTFYIDWSLYSLFLILISSLFSLKKVGGIHYFIVTIVVFLSSSIKFNILFWIGFFILLFLLYFLYTHKKEIAGKLLLWSLIGGMSGVLIGGFNPYVTNIKGGNNLFYPLMGEGKVDIMDHNTPEMFRKGNRFQNVVYSLFSLPNNHNTENMPSITQAIKDSGAQDTRRGGFGPVFIFILVGCTFLYLNSNLSSGRKRKIYNLFLLILFLALFILPAGWWARYVPFFYVFPLVMLLYTEKNGLKNKKLNIVKTAVYCFFILNIGIISSVVLLKAVKYTANVKYQLEVLKHSEPVHLFSENASFSIKLKKEGIRIIAPDETIPLDYTVIFLPSVKANAAELKLNSVPVPFIKRTEEKIKTFTGIK